MFAFGLSSSSLFIEFIIQLGLARYPSLFRMLDLTNQRPFGMADNNALSLALNVICTF